MTSILPETYPVVKSTEPSAVPSSRWQHLQARACGYLDDGRSVQAHGSHGWCPGGAGHRAGTMSGLKPTCSTTCTLPAPPSAEGRLRQWTVPSGALAVSPVWSDCEASEALSEPLNLSMVRRIWIELNVHQLSAAYSGLPSRCHRRSRSIPRSDIARTSVCARPEGLIVQSVIHHSCLIA